MIYSLRVVKKGDYFFSGINAILKLGFGTLGSCWVIEADVIASCIYMSCNDRVERLCTVVSYAAIDSESIIPSFPLFSCHFERIMRVRIMRINLLSLAWSHGFIWVFTA